MKKLLILGGARAQIPAILRAKELGYYTITCDYLPENPGHFYSDKYVNISTIDKIEVLEFARKEKVDGVIAYASDPSAPQYGPQSRAQAEIPRAGSRQADAPLWSAR